VPLAEARRQTEAIHVQISQGLDPVELRQAQRRRVITFKEAAELVHQSLLPTWKGQGDSKHAQQWINTITAYAFPKLGRMPIHEIDTPHILNVLKPLWLTKAETARRLKQRIHAIMAWAKTAGHRSGPNPVLDVDQGLPRQSKGRKHHTALPFAEVPQFITDLRGFNANLTVRLAFELLILTATRTSEVLEAQWSEFDLKKACWTIPASRMKAGREHRVPLSARAVEVLTLAQALRQPSDYVFPGRVKGRPLSNMAFLQVLRRMDSKVTAHGFRSSFRDWSAEKTNYPNEVCEMALAHTVSNQVEASYRRGDLFERRIGLMNDWATFVQTLPQADLTREDESHESPDGANMVSNSTSLGVAIFSGGQGIQAAM
jgi:integrase